MISVAAAEIPVRVFSLSSARTAQQNWGAKSWAERRAIFQALRYVLADKAVEMAELTASTKKRPMRETLTAEVVPLLEACRFLEKNAARVLRTKHYRRARPAWLGSTRFEIQRRPFGVILIIGPKNYPLFLPAVQALHALAAGNAVLLKPAPGSTAPLQLFRQIALSVGFHPDLITILGEEVDASFDRLRAGADKVVFTGSCAHGRQLLEQLAKTNTPSVMELSGADNVFVRADADLDRVTAALSFALELNGGNTCMAPRAVYAHEQICDQLQQRLLAHTIDLIITPVGDDEEALVLSADDDFGLGAAIFSRDETAAKKLAALLHTGLVTINDLIVPSADPRIPFGGIRGSGFGRTRGAEGLREMTFLHVVSFAGQSRLRHLDPAQPDDEKIIAALLKALHGRGLRKRLQALVDLVRSVRKRRKQ